MGSHRVPEGARPLTRYLVRLVKRPAYTPRDVRQISDQVRKILGSGEAASHFRVSSSAVEFNLFANSDEQLEERKTLLENKFSRVIELKLLDTVPSPKTMREALREGVELFNQERFWECHEVLEQAWRPAKGRERDKIQGLILTAAAFVHFQKGEDDICISILKRALARIGSENTLLTVDLQRVRIAISAILDTNQIQPFKIEGL